jgi:DNA-binding NarL/FixJ family response regulator
MGRHRSKRRGFRVEEPPALIIAPEAWEKIVTLLQLSSQQSRIVALILRGFCDKKIAVELGIRVATVRTHLRKVFERVNVEDRVGLVLRVVSVAQQSAAASHQN